LLVSKLLAKAEDIWETFTWEALLLTADWRGPSESEGKFFTVSLPRSLDYEEELGCLLINSILFAGKRDGVGILAVRVADLILFPEDVTTSFVIFFRLSSP